MLNFDLVDKGLGIVSPANFVYDFSAKVFLILYSKRTNFHFLFKFTSWDIGQYYIALVCYPDCDVMDFEINLIILNEPLFHMTKKLWQKLKYSENKKSF